MNLSKSNIASSLVLSSILLSLLNPLATQAMNHHVSMSSGPSKPLSNCVFPDGTSPKRAEVHCYEPKDFLKAYGIDKLHERGITGKGQVIILADSFGSPTMQADLDHFSDTFGLPHTKIQFIYPNGTYVNDLSDDDKVGWAGETTLDLEWAHAIAPDATLVNIITNTSETVGLAGFPDLFKGIEMAIQKYPGAIISMSYGTGEPTFTQSDITNYLQGSFHKIFEQATSADITLLASSGDSGNTNIDADQAKMIPFANAGYPASDPLVTAVGGTALEYGWKWSPQITADTYWDCKFNPSKNCTGDIMSSVNTRSRLETVWNEDWAFAAGGGGISTIFKSPEYQFGLHESIRKTMNGYRGLPDISMNAAINGGVEVYSSYAAPGSAQKGPNWQSTGGTSCASPEMAGIVALAGQKASDELGRTVGVGYLNPILYSLSSRDFNDIVSTRLGFAGVMIDNNGLYFSENASKKYPTKVPAVAVPGYFTSPGYDLATGLGSPKALRLVLDIARVRVERESKLTMQSN